MVATTTPGVPEAVVETLASSDGVDAVIVMGVVGSMSESQRAITELEDLKASDGAKLGACAGTGGRPEQVEPELSERELAFIMQNAALMDRFGKPIANISQRPMTQAIFSGGGRYSSFVLPSPLRAVRILGKMAYYGGYLQKKGRRQS
jgi:nucleoside phosphorylase